MIIHISVISGNDFGHGTGYDLDYGYHDGDGFGDGFGYGNGYGEGDGEGVDVLTEPSHSIYDYPFYLIQYF